MQKGSGEYCYLDKIRIYHGIDRCKAVFLEIYRKDRWGAITLLNDHHLKFPCFFILLGEIEFLRLKNFLSFRNATALYIINQLQKMKQFKNGEDYLSAHKEAVYPILKWILVTGYSDDGLDNEYDEIMDVTTSVLINSYRDKGILRIVADMIFKRNKEGHYIHNLVWAFFQSYTPYALKLIAERIHSSDQRDINLACCLLNFEVLEGNDQTYIQWLDENDPYLYFTEESFQFSSKPILYKVDLERKYLNKGSASYGRQPVVVEDENEKKCLEAFKMLSDQEKIILSEYSCKVHNKNVSRWNRWMKTSIDDQIKIARTGWEGTK